MFKIFKSVKLNVKSLLLLMSLSFFLLVGAACSDPQSGREQGNSTSEIESGLSSADLLKSAANEVTIKVGIEHNYSTENCPENEATCAIMLMQITLADDMPDSWKILFSNLVPVKAAISEEFEVIHLNGDLHQITPKVTELSSGLTYSLKLFIATPLISESVLFPNYLLVDGSGNAEVILSTTDTLREDSQVERPMHVLAFSGPEQTLRHANDNVEIQNVHTRFERYQSQPSSEKQESKQAVLNRIIPKAYQSDWTAQRIELPNGLKLAPELLRLEAGVERLNKNRLKNSSDGLSVKYQQDVNLQAEAYRLVINQSQIDVFAADDTGALYALMSLAQLYDPSSTSLPTGTMADSPAMAFRGLHIDLSRNFRSMPFMLRLLDQMAYYKLNKLHLHLADDEGWRLQIDSLPELTEVGAYRCVDDSEKSCLSPQLAAGNERQNPNNGFYTRQDYIRILKLAKARNIEIIPSLDMPGHSRAAIVAMNARYHRLLVQEKPELAEQYLLTEFEDPSQYRSIQHYNDNTLNPCLPSTYRFVTEVLTQLKAMHDEAGVDLQRYHIGADETAGAWKDSPACLAMIKETEALSSVSDLGPYFIERVAQQVADLGIIPAAWSDGLSHADPKKLPKQVQANAWGTLYSGAHNQIHDMVNQDWDVVLSLPDVLYFDFPYEADPIEPGYYWGSRNTNTFQVFQFMPFNLPVHAEIWTDKFGNQYSATQEIPLDANKSIAGIQAQLWSETVRSDRKAEYMLYPRLLAVAERAWHIPEWAEEYSSSVDYDAETKKFDDLQIASMKQDWRAFTAVLTHRAMPSLFAEGIHPRVPLPGAKLIDDSLHLNSAFIGLNTEYKTEDGKWTLYEGPVRVSTPVQVRATVPGTNLHSRYQTLH